MLAEDAAEMIGLLRSASCVDRHGAMTFEKVSEIATAIVLGGELADPGTPGYDVIAAGYGKIEVRSRFLGTDGAYPRVTLSPAKLKAADWIMAIRWTKERTIYAALMLPSVSAQPLLDTRLQVSGKTAHIAWSAWKNAPGPIDLTKDVAAAVG